jgi:hypothetical protein
MKSLEVQLNESIANVEKLEKENKELKEAVHAAKLATAKAERDAQLKESKLPKVSVDRISEAFKASADNGGLKEAINVEVEYVKQLTGSVTKKHNGAGTTAVSEAVTDMDAVRQRQYRAYRASGMNEALAKKTAGIE